MKRRLKSESKGWEARFSRAPMKRRLKTIIIHFILNHFNHLLRWKGDWKENYVNSTVAYVNRAPMKRRLKIRSSCHPSCEASNSAPMKRRLKNYPSDVVFDRTMIQLRWKGDWKEKTYRRNIELIECSDEKEIEKIKLLPIPPRKAYLAPMKRRLKMWCIGVMPMHQSKSSDEKEIENARWYEGISGSSFLLRWKGDWKRCVSYYNRTCCFMLRWKGDWKLLWDATHDYLLSKLRWKGDWKDLSSSTYYIPQNLAPMKRRLKRKM